MKVTLERDGVFITIKSNEKEEKDILECYNVNDLTSIASETLNTIFEKMNKLENHQKSFLKKNNITEIQLVRNQTNCSELDAINALKNNNNNILKTIMELETKNNLFKKRVKTVAEEENFSSEVEEDDNEIEEETEVEEEDEETEVEEEEEEEEEEENEEETEEEDEEEDEEEETEVEEEDEETEVEEEDEEENSEYKKQMSEKNEQNLSRKNMPNILFKIIQNKNSLKFTNCLDTYNFKKLIIKKTNKEQRVWVLKLIANMHDIHAWSQNKNGRRELIIQKISC